MRVIALLFAFILSSCSFPINSPPKAAPNSVVAPVMKSVVALYRDDVLSRDGKFVYCSGVITGGLVVTASHCVDDDRDYEGKMWFHEGGTAKFVTVGVDVPSDLAVLLPTDLALPDGRALSPDLPERGDRVIVVGHPYGLEWTMTDGIVSNPLRTHWGNYGAPMEFMQISAPVHPGNSGGPVFNVYGEVIGIVSFGWGGSNVLIGASPLGSVREMVSAHSLH